MNFKSVDTEMLNYYKISNFSFNFCGGCVPTSFRVTSKKKNIKIRKHEFSEFSGNIRCVKRFHVPLVSHPNKKLHTLIRGGIRGGSGLRLMIRFATDDPTL